MPRSELRAYAYPAFVLDGSERVAVEVYDLPDILVHEMTHAFAFDLIPRGLGYGISQQALPRWRDALEQYLPDEVVAEAEAEAAPAPAKARCRARSVAGTGPKPIRAGSTPA